MLSDIIITVLDNQGKLLNNYSKRIARNQLLGVHLSSLLLAGIGGMPIYGLISMIVDLFRDDDEDSAFNKVVIPAPRSEVVEFNPLEEHNDTNGWYLIDRANSFNTTC